MKNEPKVIKKAKPSKTKIEKVNEHNLGLINKQYELKMLTKKLEFSLHNIERKSSVESMWSKELSYIINKNYIAKTKNEILKSKKSLEASRDKWQNLTNGNDSTDTVRNAKLKTIKKLIEELEVTIENVSSEISVK